MEEQQIKELADAIYVEKVRRARAMPLAEKMGAGIRLFEERLVQMLRDFRTQFPDATDPEVEEMVKRQLDEERKADEAGIYTPGPILNLSKLRCPYP